MKKAIYTLASMALFFNTHLASAQTFTHKYSDGNDHARYAIENSREDLLMAGTIYENGSLTDTDIHAQRLDVNGSIVWERRYDIGSEERSADITLVNDELMIITGVTKISQQNRIFVMSLDQASGALLNYMILNPGQTSHVEQAPTEILYSPTNEQLFLAGHTFDLSTTPFPTFGNGLLFSIDPSLNTINWMKETNSQISTIEEIDGVGIYVGSATNSAVDYSGNLVWQINSGLHYNGGAIDSEYDAASDRLFVLEAYEGLIEIKNASTATPTIGQSLSYYDVKTPLRNIEHTDIELNPTTQELMLLQVTEEDMTSYRNYHPCVIRLDLNNLNVMSAHITRTHNPGAYNFDTGLNGYSIYESMKLTEWTSDFGVIFYEYPDYNVGASHEYDLRIVKTDHTGKSHLDCEEPITIKSSERALKDLTATSFVNTNYTIGTPLISDISTNHTMSDECFNFEPCGLTINHIVSDYVDCYEQNYSVNYTAAPGTVITQYEWNWGDGSSEITTNPNTSHSFSNQYCMYTVCVTITAIGTDGSICKDTHCQTVLMLNFEHCEPCGEGMRTSIPQSINNLDPSSSTELNVSPNPSNNQFIVDIKGADLDGTFTIVNTVGQVVYTSKSIEGDETRTVIDASEFESGIYVINFRNGDETISKKIIKI